MSKEQSETKLQLIPSLISLSVNPRATHSRLIFTAAMARQLHQKRLDNLSTLSDQIWRQEKKPPGFLKRLRSGKPDGFFNEFWFSEELWGETFSVILSFAKNLRIWELGTLRAAQSDSSLRFHLFGTLLC